MRELFGGGFLSDTEQPSESWIDHYTPQPDQAEVHAVIEDAAVLDINVDSGGPVFPVTDMLQARRVPFVFATGDDRADIPERLSLIKRFEKPYDPGRIVQMLFG